MACEWVSPHNHVFFMIKESHYLTLNLTVIFKLKPSETCTLGLGRQECFIVMESSCSCYITLTTLHLQFASSRVLTAFCYMCFLPPPLWKVSASWALASILLIWPQQLDVWLSFIYLVFYVTLWAYIYFNTQGMWLVNEQWFHFRLFAYDTDFELEVID